MVKYNSEQLNAVFSALSDETRRGIIARLTTESLSAQELAAPYAISLPAISKHLKVLEKADLLQRDVRGRQHFFTLNAQTLAFASEWLDHHQTFWEQSLGKLDNYLKNKTRQT